MSLVAATGDSNAAAPALAPAAACRRPGSRKGKKQWRRNIDDSHAVSTLYERSENERLGLSGNLSRADDSELFEFDRSGDASGHLGTNTLKRRKASVEAILHAAHGGLASASSVADRKRRKSAARSALVREPHSARESWLSRCEANIVLRKAKHLRREAAAATAAAAAACNTAKNKVLDLWDMEAEASADVGADATPLLVPFAAPKLVAPQEPKAKLAVPAIDVGPSGSSYNPHPEALGAVRRRNEHEKRVVMMALRDAESRTARASRANVSLAQPATLPRETTTDMDDDNGALEIDATAAATRLETPRLTRVQKNKQKRIKQMAKAIEAARARKRILQQAAKANVLLKAINRWEQRLKKRSLRRAQQREMRERMPQRLSRFTYVPDTVTPHAHDEGAGGPFVLRRVRPVTNLIRDRFLSFQRRNMIEARARTKCTRKYALQTYEQRSYKDFDQGIL